MKSSSCLSCLTFVLAVSAPAFSQTVPVPETIRAEGVPPVPAAVRQALNRYQNIRSASFQGKGMYITTRFADVPQVQGEEGRSRTRGERRAPAAPRPVSLCD